MSVERHNVPLLHRMARNYASCLVPEEMVAAQMDEEAGLRELRAVIAALYEHLSQQPVTTKKLASNGTACAAVLDAPLVLLWALGKAGTLAGGPELVADRATLRPLLAVRKVNKLAVPAAALSAVGVDLTPCAADGALCDEGLDDCETLCARYQAAPARAQALLCSLARFAPLLDLKTMDGLNAFARADFRVLSGFPVGPGAFTEDEVVRAMDAPVAALWRDWVARTSARYPEYRQVFRRPQLRQRSWVADYTRRGKGYGVWRVTANEDGLSVQMVMRPEARAQVLAHLDEYPYSIQELFLTSIRCRNCAAHCGEHQMFEHGDHVHKLCRVTWFYTPPLAAGDLPWIERILAVHVAAKGR